MKSIILLTFIGLLSFSYAQDSYNVVELEPSKGKTRGSSFIGIDEDGFIYTASVKTTYIVVGMLTKSYLKVFNAKTGQMHIEKPLEKSKALKRRGLEYVSLTFLDKKPTIICKEAKAKEPVDYYGIHIDRNGELQGDKFKIGASGDCSGFRNRGKSFYSGVYQFRTEEGESTFISDVSCRGDEQKTYRVLELDKNLELENSYTFSLDYESVSNLSYERGKEHSYVKVQTRTRKKVDGKLFKRWITTHRLFKVNRRNGNLEEIDLKERFEPLVVGDFRLKIIDGGVLLSGQIIQEKGFAGLFTAVLKDKEYEISDIRTEDFDMDFISKYWSDREKKKNERRRNRRGESEDDENFSTNFQLMETFKTNDEGLISVFQEFILRVVTHSSTNSNGVTTTTTDYYYYYKDVIVVKTGQDGKIEYTKLLPFYQVTKNYDPGKGYSALQIGNELFFLHGTSNEISEMIEEGEKSRKKSRWRDRRIQYASVTHLSQDGDVNTEQVLDLRERKVSIDPNNVAVDKMNKQFVIVSPVMKMFNLKKTKVIRIEI